MPVSDLQVLNTTFDIEGSAAPMFDKINDENKWPNLPINDWGFFVLGLKQQTAQLPFGIPLVGLEAYLNHFSPDVVINYNVSSYKSDNAKEIMYHEYAHVSHYTRMLPNAADYWTIDLPLFVMDPGYGTDPNTSRGKRVSINENWAYFIGPIVADEAYDLKHSGTQSSNILDIQRTRWKNTNEKSMFYSTNTTVDGFYIRVGLYRDLWDINPTGDPYENGDLVGFENFGGITPVDILSLMDHNMQSPAQLKNAIQNGFVSNSNLNNYNILMTKYGL